MMHFGFQIITAEKETIKPGCTFEYIAFCGRRSKLSDSESG
jgi:hypothetical protein